MIWHQHRIGCWCLSTNWYKTTTTTAILFANLLPWSPRYYHHHYRMARIFPGISISSTYIDWPSGKANNKFTIIPSACVGTSTLSRFQFSIHYHLFKVTVARPISMASNGRSKGKSTWQIVDRSHCARVHKWMMFLLLLGKHPREIYSLIQNKTELNWQLFAMAALLFFFPLWSCFRFLTHEFIVLLSKLWTILVIKVASEDDIQPVRNQFSPNIFVVVVDVACQDLIESTCSGQLVAFACHRVNFLIVAQQQSSLPRHTWISWSGQTPITCTTLCEYNPVRIRLLTNKKLLYFCISEFCLLGTSWKNWHLNTKFTK